MIELPERYNASMLLDANLEAGRAAKVALVCGDERITYGELLGRVCAMGHALRRLGVGREQRVLLILDDTPAFPVAFFGAMRIGAVPVPVNPLYRAADYRHFLEDSDARAIVAEHTYLEKVRQALAGYPEPVAVVAAGERVEGAHYLPDLLAAEPGDLAPAPTHRDDMAFWLYSSGSTGKPKGVVHLHHDIPYTCETYARHVLRITADDVVFGRVLFHAYGLGAALTFPFWAGATTILRPGRPTPQGILQTLQRYRPTLFFSVPMLYHAIVTSPEAADADLSFVRMCVSAAEPLPPETWRRWRETFGHEIMDGIGSTELLHIFCSNAPGAVRPGSSGRPVPGYELQVCDREGRPVAPGEVGALRVKGDSAAPCYWRRHEKSQQTMRGEWVETGDLYRVDAEGFYWYEGRADDMIKVHGEWVSPIEIENRLLEHPAVREVAVVGAASDGPTRIKAAVILAPDTTPTPRLVPQLQQWCKSRLHRHQYPHIVEFVDDLPKTVTGKIQRFKLREVGA